jgi:hypothetical protein
MATRLPESCATAAAFIFCAVCAVAVGTSISII